MQTAKTPIQKILSPNPKHKNQWHFIHWRFVPGIMTGYLPYWGLYSFELNSLRAFFRWWESVDGELFKWLRCVACRQRLMIKLMAGWHPNKPAVTYPRVTCNKKINNIIGNEYFSFKIKVTPILESCIANPKALLNSLGLSLLSFTYDESGNNNFSRTWLYYSLRKLTYAHKNLEKVEQFWQRFISFRLTRRDQQSFMM